MFFSPRINFDRISVPPKSLIAWVVLFWGSISFTDASAQVFGGGFVERSFESTQRRDGFGGELGLKVAFLPVEIFGSGSHFPERQQDPSLRVWSLGARIQISPFPFVKPYLVGGLGLKEYEGADSGMTHSEEGRFLGLGVKTTIKEVKFYAESKYAFQSTSAMSIRLGASLSWGGLPF